MLETHFLALSIIRWGKEFFQKESTITLVIKVRRTNLLEVYKLVVLPREKNELELIEKDQTLKFSYMDIVIFSYMDIVVCFNQAGSGNQQSFESGLHRISDD